MSLLLVGVASVIFPGQSVSLKRWGRQREDGAFVVTLNGTSVGGLVTARKQKQESLSLQWRLALGHCLTNSAVL